MKRPGMRSRVGALVALLIAAFAISGARAADNSFSCRASLLRLTGAGPFDGQVFEPVVANDASSPCAADTKGVADALGIADAPAPFGGDAFALPGDLGSVRILYTETAAGPNAGTAESGVAAVELTIPGAPVIQAAVLTSQASVTCTDGAPVFDSSSHVAWIAIGEQVIDPAPDNFHQDIGPISIDLNKTTTTSNSVTQQALSVDTPLGSIVVAESEADFTGSPCGPPPPPQCSDGKDNDGDGKIDYPADPGCTSADDNDETDVAGPPQCSDGKDNDGDGKIDYPADPGCSSADDNDETDVAGPPQCSDGIDNDNDGRADYPNDPGCSSPTDNDETDEPGLDGYMTGGGTIGDPSAATHGFSLDCTAIDPAHESLTVQWDTGDFHLDTMTSSRCFDDPNVNPKPARQGFDTLTGGGNGTCLGEPATATWTFTDGGEPGTRDHAHIEIDGGPAACDLTADGFLVKGNQQAHPA